MMKKNLKISILFLLFICNSCLGGDVMDDEEFNSIIKKIYIKKEKPNIDFNKIVPVKWDRMYVIDAENFPEIDTKEEISKLIGVRYTGGFKEDDSDRSIIFIKSKRIVYEIFSDFEETSWEDNEYFVNFVISKKMLFFTPQNAIFTIKYKVDKKEGFNLIPM